jgi:hypothetical protein
MNDKSLAVYQPTTLKEFIEVGNIFATSGYFKDATAGAQAIVKIMAGREIGLGLFESMNGFHIIEGKMTMAANLIATLIKRAPGYDYKVLELTRERCEIEFYRDGESLGKSEFTIGDAKKAGLLKPNSNWEKWPQNMVFARAVSNGVRFYCPEVTGGIPVYTPDELGQEVGENGEALNYEPPKPVVINGEFTSVAHVGEREERVNHWIDNSRAAFWGWAKGTMGLTETQVYEALGVEHIHDFTGDKKAAMERITAFAQTTEQSKGELDKWFDSPPPTLAAAMRENSLLCPAGTDEEALAVWALAKERDVEIDPKDLGAAIRALETMIGNEADEEAARQEEMFS